MGSEILESEPKIREIIPLLKPGEGVPDPKFAAGKIQTDEGGRLINPYEDLPDTESPLSYPLNLTEDMVVVAIGEQITTVDVTRKDAEKRGVPGEHSNVGGFKEKGEPWGKGETGRREAKEEIGLDIRTNQIDHLEDWYARDDPRNRKHKYIVTSAHLAIVAVDDLKNLKPGDDAGGVKPVIVNSEFFSGNFYADHKKSFQVAIRKIQDRTGMIVDRDGYLRMPVQESTIKLMKDHPEAACEEIAKQFAGKWENTGPSQLLRILKENGGDIDKAGVEIANREILTDQLWKSEKPVEEFLTNFDKYSSLFESLVDGGGYSFSRFIEKNLPLLAEIARTEKNPLATQDYSDQGPGLPGYDWRLAEKGLIRVSKALNAISGEKPDRLMAKISRDKFERIVEIAKNLRNGRLLDLFNLTAIHLDVAKGGSPAKREDWSRNGINPDVHNEASYKLLKLDGTLEKIIDELDIIKNLDEKEKKTLAELFGKMVEYHGYVGQSVRGEVTSTRFQGLTDWIKENSGDIKSVLQKLDIDQGVPTFVGDLYYLINVIDTVSVRDGLYTDVMDAEFRNFESQFERVIRGDIDWEGIIQEKLDSISPKGETKDAETNRKREFLAKRLTRLRGGKDSLEVLGTLLSLDKEKVDYIFDLLKNSQLWYVENASVELSVENQLKLITLVSKIAKEKGTDKYGNFDVNFAPLMNTLRPEKNTNRALTRVIDTGLYKLSWDEVISNTNSGNIRPEENGNLEIVVKGDSGNGMVEIDCVLNEGMKRACELINTYYFGDRKDNPDFVRAVDILNSWTGIKRDEWDRVFDQELYMVTMNATMKQKIEGILPIVEEAKRNGKKVVVVGIGSGTGELEHALAVSGELGEDDMVIGTDISSAMVGNMERISKVIKANKYLSPEASIATMKAAKTDASTVNLKDIGVVEDGNTVVIFSLYSVNHEFASYTTDKFKYGKFVASVYSNLMAPEIDEKQNFKVGDEIVIRDFIQDENPDEKIKLKIGEAFGKEENPAKFLRDFSKEFKGFTESEKKELENLPEVITKDTEIQISKSLAMEIMGHYSWLKDGKNNKERDERYGYFDAEGFKKWFNAIAESQGIKIEIEIQINPAKYEEYIGGRMDAFDSSGKSIPVPLSMATIVIKRVG